MNLSGFVSVVTTQMGTGSRQDFGEASFALLSARYMLLSLHLGYHFTTFESMVTPEPSKNYIRMQFKGGGASADRRGRRIRLVMDLLSKMGFEHVSRGDFLDTSYTYADEAATAERLRLLGRLTMLTKQLDMALSNDSIAEWYTEDFALKLGLDAETKDDHHVGQVHRLTPRAGTDGPEGCVDDEDFTVPYQEVRRLDVAVSEAGVPKPSHYVQGVFDDLVGDLSLADLTRTVEELRDY